MLKAGSADRTAHKSLETGTGQDFLWAVTFFSLYCGGKKFRRRKNPAAEYNRLL